jgi:hypothetical protein
MNLKVTCLVAGLLLVPATTAWADPCGMVPPIYVGNESPITRVGLQNTYVFYKDGIETFVIRPGFTGKVDEFGMLIPFPTPPALRKVPDEIFAHLEKAVDPPEVIVNLFPLPPGPVATSAMPQNAAPDHKSGLKFHEVRVISREAVGMYEVAVLEAGSAAALKRWMDDHGFKYPTGMDKVCDEYVALGWCFVAEKTRVAQKPGVDPKPRMKGVTSKLPSGSTFDGYVQGMGFRFKTDKLVVPMRLSAYNEGDLRNVVYLLTEGPRRIRAIPEEYVVRQLTGRELCGNLTSPLPLRVLGGTVADIPDWRRKSLSQERDPRPHNGQAKELFASDLLAVRQGRLSHPHEEHEKMMLRVGEHFGLRGPEIDRLNLAALEEDRTKAVAAAVGEIKNMTLTVVDGDFPREVLGGQNLQFAEYVMPSRRNTPLNYDAKHHGPTPRPQGVRHEGALSFEISPTKSNLRFSWRQVVGLAAAFATLFVGIAAFRRPRLRKKAA